MHYPLDSALPLLLHESESNTNAGCGQRPRHTLVVLWFADPLPNPSLGKPRWISDLETTLIPSFALAGDASSVLGRLSAIL